MKMVIIPINPNSRGDNSLARIMPTMNDNPRLEVFSIKLHLSPLMVCCLRVNKIPNQLNCFYFFDKNFLFVNGSIGNVELYVKIILTTKCGVRPQWPRRRYIAILDLMRNLLTFWSAQPPRRSIWPEFRQTSPARLFLWCIMILYIHPTYILGGRR